MKLLKLLVTGVVALAVSTSALATRLVSEYQMKLAVNGAPGLAVAENIVVVSEGLIMDFSQPVIHQGVFTSIEDPVGELAQTPSGALNSRSVQLQYEFALRFNKSNLHHSIIAARECAKLSDENYDYFQPSILQLKRIQADAATLVSNFDALQENVMNPGYHYPNTAEGQRERVAMRAKLAEFARFPDALLSSNESSDGRRAIAVEKDGSEVEVYKNLTTDYICASRYQPSVSRTWHF